MITGTIMSFGQDLGIGHIQGKDGNIYFIHVNDVSKAVSTPTPRIVPKESPNLVALASSFVWPQAGDEIAFEPATSSGGGIKACPWVYQAEIDRLRGDAPSIYTRDEVLDYVYSPAEVNFDLKHGPVDETGRYEGIFARYLFSGYGWIIYFDPEGKLCEIYAHISDRCLFGIDAEANMVYFEPRKTIYEEISPRTGDRVTLHLGFEPKGPRARPWGFQFDWDAAERKLRNLKQ